VGFGARTGVWHAPSMVSGCELDRRDSCLRPGSLRSARVFSRFFSRNFFSVGLDRGVYPCNGVGSTRGELRRAVVELAAAVSERRHIHRDFFRRILCLQFDRLAAASLGKPVVYQITQSRRRAACRLGKGRGYPGACSFLFGWRGLSFQGQHGKFSRFVFVAAAVAVCRRNYSSWQATASDSTERGRGGSHPQALTLS